MSKYTCMLWYIKQTAPRFITRIQTNFHGFNLDLLQRELFQMYW